MPFQMPRVNAGARGVGVPQVRGIGQGQEVNAQTMQAIQQFAQTIKQRRLEDQQRFAAKQEAEKLGAERNAQEQYARNSGVNPIPGSSNELLGNMISQKQKVDAHRTAENDKLTYQDNTDAHAQDKQNTLWEHQAELLKNKRLYEKEVSTELQKDKTANIELRNKGLLEAADKNKPINPLTKTRLTEIAKGLGPGLKEAQGASDSILTAQKSLDILEEGIKTGFGSDFRMSFGRALGSIGFSTDMDEIARTQTFVANQIELLKPYVEAQGGRGFTDADMKIYMKAIGADPNLDPKALKDIIQLGIKYSRLKIGRHNEGIDSLKKSKYWEDIREMTVDQPPKWKSKKGGLQGMLNPQAQQQPEGAPGSAVEFINKAIAGGMDRQEAINKAVEMRLN